KGILYKLIFFIKIILRVHYQWFLFFGVLLLTTTIFVSFWSVLRLEKLTENHQKTLAITNKIDNIERLINEYTLIIKDDSKNTDLSNAAELINKNFLEAENQIADNKEKLTLLNNAKTHWNHILNNRNQINIGQLTSLDKIFSKIDRLEMDQIQARDPEIISTVNHLMSLMIFLCLLSFVVIGYSLRSIQKQNRVRKEFMIELQKSQKSAEEASNAKSKFLATVSHELRTPLNGIIGLSDVLFHSNLSDKERGFVSAITASGKTLLRIINDILDFTKIESGTMKMEQQSFVIKDVFRQIIETLSEKVKEKNLSLEFKYDENLPPKVLGDPDRLAQVLFNLVGNSIKFTSSGGILIKANLQHANSTQIHAADVLIEFSVEDTGIGISNEQMSQLFKPFTQLQKTGTSGESGTGLGLSIAQQIVRMMGGEITVNSSPSGSRFSFTLNMKRERRASPHSKTVPNVPEKNPTFLNQGNSSLILVVEDNPTNQIVISSMLEKMNIHSVMASNGVEALEALQKNTFDLILMDCFMPIMDGFEATKKMREQQVSTPIMAMTASANPDDETLCYKVGMNGFITKPITLETLYKQILPFLKNQTKQSSFSPANETLKKLSSSIGIQPTKKIVSIFIKTLDDLVQCVQNEENLETLHRLGHKYKSSTQTVGALHLFELCKSLESAESLEKAKIICSKIKSEIPTTAQILQKECETI
ncbi:response regulator, partial [bacterium]|nr:response regulator [bacterium]